MEIVDIYDGKKNKTGKTVERSEKPILGEYRLSIHIWITNSKGEILIQRRSANKKMFPNMWNETGGAAISKETSEMTCAREFEEELGVKPNMNKAELIGTIKRKYDYVDVWYIKQDIDLKDIKMQKDEVSEVKYVTLQELNQIIENKEFVPTITPSLNMFLNYLEMIKEEQNTKQVWHA